MITDDPGTTNNGHFEINTSVNSEITDKDQFSAPLLDINYGANERMQLKVQIPYDITVNSENKNSIGVIGYPLVGVKYRFLDEGKNFMSVSTYPQILVTGYQGELLLPIELQKTIGRFTIGEEIGYFFIERKSQNSFSGSLLGFNLSKKTELLIEFYNEYNFNGGYTDGYVNGGFRYVFNKTFILLASCGTQAIFAQTGQRQYFFSFLGLQTIF